MKYLFIVLVLLICSCTQQNNNATIKWIKDAKHPIKVIYAGGNLSGDNLYTLIDANSNIYSTGMVEFRLDTIIP